MGFSGVQRLHYQGSEFSSQKGTMNSVHTVVNDTCQEVPMRTQEKARGQRIGPMPAALIQFSFPLIAAVLAGIGGFLVARQETTMTVLWSLGVGLLIVLRIVADRRG